ncbi:MULTISPECIES: type III secretion system needle length determinant, SpaN/EivJ family [unclassified Undibacterium]|uniref:SpaN/EivJ family type III secretion system needle length determinant n=1 Tax=unclassified Undibacterium TaxID=2630295 RepID=UPI002AC8C4DB|nr:MULTISPECIES: type III secretion system needle length determinant, SpaN/EivJ family [unclassified Undibacterium]MEB0140390.1 type III secretion system needle length determinant, SpaN/EivJ family [Undibacterium sp. CCC2.1]MEB0173424.1 type III secretion system needle length determinant, SpaN/EivJ family [Undibacterium sp. CCC1.1]MEB0177324.1 type III secretion system needle length determinant, SpaN/EivJ family [Undibacterium sp. CCC3.4]MEB0216581.1 type III secretion system needle length dete
MTNINPSTAMRSAAQATTTASGAQGVSTAFDREVEQLRKKKQAYREAEDMMVAALPFMPSTALQARARAGTLSTSQAIAVDDDADADAIADTERSASSSASNSLPTDVSHLASQAILFQHSPSYQHASLASTVRRRALPPTSNLTLAAVNTPILAASAASVQRSGKLVADLAVRPSERQERLGSDMQAPQAPQARQAQQHAAGNSAALNGAVSPAMLGVLASQVGSVVLPDPARILKAIADVAAPLPARPEPSGSLPEISTVLSLQQLRTNVHLSLPHRARSLMALPGELVEQKSSTLPSPAVSAELRAAPKSTSVNESAAAARVGKQARALPTELVHAASAMSSPRPSWSTPNPASLERALVSSSRMNEPSAPLRVDKKMRAVVDDLLAAETVAPQRAPHAPELRTQTATPAQSPPQLPSERLSAEAPLLGTQVTYQFKTWGKEHAVRLQAASEAAPFLLQPSDPLVAQRLDHYSGQLPAPVEWQLLQDEDQGDRQARPDFLDDEEETA